MAWQRQMGGMAGPLSASGEASNGNPVQVELFVSGAWVDITAYVMVRDESGNIAVTRGRRDEGSTSEQATCTLTLNNRDGRWSPRNPTGVYYGVIGRNTPIRVSVPDGLGGKSYRFQGEVSLWPQSWDPTGTDVYTEIEANGILRRLAQGPAPAYSLMRTALATYPSANLRAYWPCEDAEGSTSLASVLTTGSAMTWTGTPTLAGFDGFPASDPVISTVSNVLAGGVARYDDPTATQVRFLCSIPSDGLVNGTVVCSIDQQDYSAGSAQIFDLYYGNFGGTGHGMTLHTMASDGTDLGADLENTFDVRGKTLYVSIELQESGTGITRALRIYDISAQVSYDVSDTETLTQLTRVTRVQFGPASRSAASPHGSTGLSSVAIGHVTVEDIITPNTGLGVRLNPIGEAAGARIQRLCSDNSIGFESVGVLSDTVLMGNQGKLNPLELMQECELADGGMLYESMPSLGLGYRTRASLQNQDAQLTLNYTGFNLSEVPTPVEDDRYIQNQVTVTVGSVSQTYALTTGSLNTAQPPAGVGVYGTDVTLNLQHTNEALSQAAWRVHLGTVDEPRYPEISVNLAHSSFTSNPALKQAVLALRQGDRIVVQNPPSWLPPGDIDQLILGFSETITHFEHRLTFICAPASPYNTIGVLGASTARLDTDGSQLAAGVTSTATSLSVATTSGPVWVQYGQLNANSDFEINLTNWSASGSTIARVATPGSPPFDGLWSLQITPDGVAQFPNAGSEQIAVVAGQSYTLQGWMYCVTARAVDLNINWFDAAHAYLSTSGDEVTVAANTWTYFSGSGVAPVGSAFANCAPTVPNFPPSTDVLTADKIVFHLTGDSVSPDDFPFDIRVGGEVMRVTSITGGTSPQTFTVTRSINGVVKSHSAGEDVRLAYPTYVSL
jgi:hypothetical protein